MSENNKGNNPLSGIDLSSLQNMDLSSLMSNVLNNVDSNKFQSMLSSLNLNGDSLNKMFDMMKAATTPGENKQGLDMGQLNALASDVLKGLDTSKLQSMVSNNIGGQEANSVTNMLDSIMSSIKPPVQNAQAPAGNTVPVHNAPEPATSNTAGSVQSVQSMMSKFKPPVNLTQQTVLSALNIGGTQNDLRSQFEAILSTMNLDAESKEKMLGGLNDIMGKSMLSFDTLKNGFGFGGLNLQQMMPMLSNLLGAMMTQKK